MDMGSDSVVPVFYCSSSICFDDGVIDLNVNTSELLRFLRTQGDITAEDMRRNESGHERT